MVLPNFQLPRFAVVMMPLELWRARIGTFNNKRCSCCSLSSLSSLSLASSPQFRRHIDSTNVSQEEPASTALTSSSSSSAIKEQSQEFFSTDHHSVLTTSSSQLTLSCFSQSYGSGFFAASSFSFSQSSSPFFPTFDSRRRSLLREAVITLLIAIISQLLIIAGDIETNPGPKHGGEVHMLYCSWKVDGSFGILFVC